MNVKGKFLAAAAMLAFALMLTIHDAQAARLGGGKSFGMSRNSSTLRQPATPAKPTQNVTPSNATGAAGAPVPAKPGMSRWLGPLAGIAAGIGLAALFSHLGMGEGMADFMMIALLVMAGVFLIRWLMSRRQPQTDLQYAGNGRAAQPLRFEPASPPPGALPSQVSVGAGDTPLSNANEPTIPADFDVAGFVRQAKLNFVRLQAANDRGDLDDIREFTAPEVFAEIQMQLQERGKVAQQTDVVQLEAELLRVDTENGRHIASVRFFGQLREVATAPPQDFEEVWHLAKPVDGSRGWQVAGIQQLQ